MSKYYFRGIAFPDMKEASVPGYSGTYLNKKQMKDMCDAYAVVRKTGRSFPVVLEHEDKRILGRVVSFYIDDKNNLCALGELEDATYAESLAKKNGRVGLSLKMNHHTSPVEEDGELIRIGIKQKDLVHLGIVEDPAFGDEGSWVQMMSDSPLDIATPIRESIVKGDYYMSEEDKKYFASSPTPVEVKEPDPEISPAPTKESIQSAYQVLTSVASKFSNMDATMTDGNQIIPVIDGNKSNLPNEAPQDTSNVPQVAVPQPSQQTSDATTTSGNKRKRDENDTSSTEAQLEVAQQRLEENNKAARLLQLLEKYGLTGEEEIRSKLSLLEEAEAKRKQEFEAKKKLLMKNINETEAIDKNERQTLLLGLKELFNNPIGELFNSFSITTAASIRSQQTQKALEAEIARLNKQLEQERKAKQEYESMVKMGSQVTKVVTNKTFTDMRNEEMELDALIRRSIGLTDPEPTHSAMVVEPTTTTTTNFVANQVSSQTSFSNTVPQNTTTITAASIPERVTSVAHANNSNPLQDFISKRFEKRLGNVFRGDSSNGAFSRIVQDQTKSVISVGFTPVEKFGNIYEYPAPRLENATNANGPMFGFEVRQVPYV